MLTPDEVLRRAIEFAELEYLSARNRGVPSPVIELNATDPDNPDKVDLTVWQRKNLVGSLRTRGERGIGAARSLDRPEEPGYFSVVVSAERGIFVFKMPIEEHAGPEQDDPADG